MGQREVERPEAGVGAEVQAHAGAHVPQLGGLARRPGVPDLGGGADYTGSGVQAHIVAGNPIIPTTTNRMFIQHDTTIPL